MMKDWKISILSPWRRVGLGWTSPHFSNIQRVATKKTEAVSLHGPTWRGQGATGASCTSRDLILIKEFFHSEKNHSLEQPS